MVLDPGKGILYKKGSARHFLSGVGKGGNTEMGCGEGAGPGWK